MEEELRNSAGMLEGQREMDDRSGHSSRGDENAAGQSESPWENLGIGQEKVKKIRKPVTAKDWFAEVRSDSEADSSTDSQEEEEGKWNEIKRRERSQRIRQERKKRKKERMEAMASRMRHMVGVGPIPSASIRFFEDSSKDDNEARIKAVKEYLKYYMEFDDDDLNLIEILDTKRVANDDIVYFSVSNEDHIREIYMRRAAIANDDLIVRDYIPPQYHARYMAVAGHAKQKRAEDKSLKTQLRWGHYDI